jgi:hypothetical protein
MDRRSFNLSLPAAGAWATEPATAAQPTSRTGTAPPTLSDPRLGKFNPLRRILFYDDFDDGINGWAELVANHVGDLDQLRPVLRDMRPAQLSSCTFFDIGTHGSLDGTYALKLATRPRPFHTAAAVKRLTFPKPALVQVEMFFTFKPEQTFGARPDSEFDGNASPSELDFGDFTISNDICEGESGPRYMCALRYWNTDLAGKPVQKWSYKTSLHTTTKMDRQGLGEQTQDFHVRKVDDWADIPGGRQVLCFNETATKVNWHYLRWQFDLRTRRNVLIQVNDLQLDLRQIPVPAYDHGYKALNHLFNFVIDVRTHKPVRNFLFIDSVLTSVEW